MIEFIIMVFCSIAASMAVDSLFWESSNCNEVPNLKFTEEDIVLSAKIQKDNFECIEKALAEIKITKNTW